MQTTSMRLKLAALILSAAQVALVAPYFLYTARTALGVAFAVLSFALPVLVAVMLITEDTPQVLKLRAKARSSW